MALSEISIPAQAQTIPDAGQASACQMVEATIYFAQGTDELSEFASDALKKALDDLSGCELAAINVIGYADAEGPSEQNLLLSERRAQSALDFVLSHGIEARHVEVAGGGDLIAKNARTEMSFVGYRKADVRFIPATPSA
tara:strand:- start:7309 stop:7728 length:420 start_codon:yes stop_codon:yes gene_type:complete